VGAIERKTNPHALDVGRVDRRKCGLTMSTRRSGAACRFRKDSSGARNIRPKIGMSTAGATCSRLDMGAMGGVAPALSGIVDAKTQRATRGRGAIFATGAGDSTRQMGETPARRTNSAGRIGALKN